MTLLRDLITQPAPATSEAIRSHIGRPLSPCAACQCPLFNVDHFANLRCASCGSGRLNERRGDDAELRKHVPLRLLVVVNPDGGTVAEEWRFRSSTQGGGEEAGSYEKKRERDEWEW